MISNKIDQILFQRIHKYQQSNSYQDFFELPYSARIILGMSDFINSIKVKKHEDKKIEINASKK